MQSNVSFVVALLWIAFQLIVVIGGIILAATWWRRAPRAATLTMIGLSLMLLCELASTGMNRYWSTGRGVRGETIVIVTYGFQILRTLGLGVLVAAVFAGRPRGGEGRAFEVQKVSAVAVAEQ